MNPKIRLPRTLVTAALVVVAVAGFGAFGQQVPAGADVTVSVTPAQGLADGQTVHIKASGLPANHSPIQVVQCAHGAVDSLRCDGDTLDVSEDTDAQGKYDNPHYVVHTLLQKNHDSIDCDVNHACEIYVGVDYNNTFKVNSATTPISFGSPARASKASKPKGGSSVPILPIAAGVAVVVLGAALLLRSRASRTRIHSS